MPEHKPDPPPVAEVAAQLAERLESVGCDYALGGAVALAFWAEPRGTIDVDVSLYLPIKELGQTIAVFHKIGAECSETNVRESLTAHGFCSIHFLSRRLDVFLPIASIYEAARGRRQRVQLGNREVWIWDAETFVRVQDDVLSPQGPRRRGEHLARAGKAARYRLGGESIAGNVFSAQSADLRVAGDRGAISRRMNCGIMEGNREQVHEAN